MRGVHIFEKPCCREIRAMRGGAMRGLPVSKIMKIIKILGIEKIEMLIPFFLAKLHFPNATLL